MIVYFFIVLIVFSIDFFSKLFIKRKFKLNKEYKISNKFYIYHTKNNGLAFGFFKNFQKIIKSILTFSILILFGIFLISLKDNSKIKKTALSFILGGSLANYYDRMKNKNVTDFIYIKYKNAPVYNLADFFILFSICLLFFKSLKDIFNKYFSL